MKDLISNFIFSANLSKISILNIAKHFGTPSDLSPNSFMLKQIVPFSIRSIAALACDVVRFLLRKL